MSESTAARHVKRLIKKASETGDSGEAARFAQAAMDAARALVALREAEKL